MYDLTDTIVAPGSTTSGVRSVIRLSGADSWSICQSLAVETDEASQPGIQTTEVRALDDVTLPAWIYRFRSPRSYTGQDCAEIHVLGNAPLLEALVQRCLSLGARMAGPGEFTARAYLNGKLDLAQAEAVNEIIAGSNVLQVQAAQRLLTGRLSDQTEQLREDLLNLMGLLEAGMDFSEEDIEFISEDQANERLDQLDHQITTLLDQGIAQEEILHLPAVGIAGAPNAGKSSLFNALLGRSQSLVSDQRKTTRDVLCQVWDLPHGRCVLFDCAGLLVEPAELLDRLAQEAALEALRHCQLILFCVDATKIDLDEDRHLRETIESHQVLNVATKTDLVDVTTLSNRWNAPWIPVSAAQSQGLDNLIQQIDQTLMTGHLGVQSQVTTLTARHKQALIEAQTCLQTARISLPQGGHEIVVMELRAAYQAISQMEHHVEEKVLDRIFSQFCIGK